MTKKRVKPILLIVSFGALIIGLSSCNHMTPKGVAKSYAADYKMMNASAVSNLYKHENDEKRNAYTEYLEEIFENMSSEEKAEAKSVTFKSYAKVSGGKENEKGTLTVTYKANGEGEKLDKAVELDFVKVKSKWYLKPDKTEGETQSIGAETNSGAYTKDGFKQKLTETGGALKDFGRYIKDFGKRIADEIKK